LITRGADIGHGLAGACLAGRINLAKFLITKGAVDFNWGLACACRGGHKILVKLMIAKGARNCSCGKSINDH
jgi:hypothetical protein